ncbi:hypothetical protein ACLQ3K_25900 [Tsukamurella sp. DT100]|uniref:hypothetical protein n=1 Tax=Tsukamurella sp. DT100 TaxID=3393415 RepID=UPI003CF8651C
MHFESMRGEPLHYVAQEIRAAGGDIDHPIDLMVSVTRLSGGYKHLKDSLYVERSDSDGILHYAAYWIDSEVLGIVVTSTPTDPEDTIKPTTKGRVIRLDALQEVAIGDTCVVRNDSFISSDVEMDAAWRLVLTDGSAIIVPKFGIPGDSTRRGRLDKFIDAAFAAIRTS